MSVTALEAPPSGSPQDVPLSRNVPRPKSAYARRRELWGFLFVLPVILFLVLVILGPLLFGFWISLHSWNPLASLAEAKWVGLKNYQYLLTIDKRFLPSLVNSFYYAIARVIGNVILGLGLALLMNYPKLKGLRVWRIALFLPMATSPVVLAQIWANMFHKDFGIINAFTGLAGFPAVGWLVNPDTALAAVIIMGTYQFVGYYAIIYLAGLQGIQEELLEAACLDGASGWQKFWYITFPLLQPVTAFVTVISTINGLQVFDLVYTSTGGGPADATNTVVLQMYKTVFVNSRAGQGAAMAFILFAIVMVLSIIQLRLLKDRS